MFQNSILRNIHYKTHEILKFNYLKKKEEEKKRKIYQRWFPKILDQEKMFNFIISLFVK